MKKERRTAARFTIDQNFKLEFMHEEFVPSMGINLSAAGLLCHTDSEIELGTRVFLMLTVNHENDERHISAEGVVVRTKKIQQGYESGIQFTTIAPDDKSYLLSKEPIP